MLSQFFRPARRKMRQSDYLKLRHPDQIGAFDVMIERGNGALQN
jgi:hypothetical protein